MEKAFQNNAKKVAPYVVPFQTSQNHYNDWMNNEDLKNETNPLKTSPSPNLKAKKRL